MLRNRTATTQAGAVRRLMIVLQVLILVGCRVAPPEPHVLPKLEIIETDIQTAGGTSIQQWTFISGDMSKEGLEILLLQHFDSLEAKHGTVTTAWIRLYHSKKAAEAAAAQSRASWSAGLLYKSGEVGPRLVLHPLRWQRILQGPRERFGLTEQERMDIYKKIRETSRTVEAEVMKQAPHDEAKQKALRKKLGAERNVTLAAAHGITPALMDSIFYEGIDYGWGWMVPDEH